MQISRQNAAPGPVENHSGDAPGDAQGDGNGLVEKKTSFSLIPWTLIPRGVPLTGCSMFARPFVLQTGIWLISELVVHGRIPAVVSPAVSRLRLHVTRVSLYLSLALHLSVSLFISFADRVSLNLRLIGIYRTCSCVHAYKYLLRVERFDLYFRRSFYLMTWILTDFYFKMVVTRNAMYFEI